jgi:tetratricopeptide (TPR) repeat protein
MATDLNYKKANPVFLVFTILSVLLFISSCSTKKNTWTRRAYHNVTAHYNVYWNGMDNMRQGIKEFNASVKDNYSMILPVFNYGDKASASKMSQYGDLAIKKAQKCITKHSMVFGKKEYNRWIDDCYMLMGKAYFYKQDYPMARRTFEFVVKTFNENEIKYEAMLWMAQANMQLGEFSRAEPLLDMVQDKIKNGQAPDKYERDLDLIYANFYILQKNYPPAAEYINRALELNPSRTQKTRCLFILAQIHQYNGELPEASKLYTTVLRRNPSYDMEFNSKISLARCYIANSGDKASIVKKLTKMLKDDKNKDNLDQVHYALSEIYLKDADTNSAMDYLRKSVATSRVNNYQKAISALQLADIYFSRKNYPDAQAYYDSTLQFLPKDYPNYKELSKKTATLTDLVTNLEIIQRQDSLQKLAAMSESDRDRVIDGIISKLIEEEQKKQQEEFERQQNLALFGDKTDNLQGGQSVGTGSWYFYNPTTMANGYSTFMKKWGRRKAEDNWFLSDKSVAAFANEEAKTDTTAEEGAEPEAGDTIKGKKGAGKDDKSKDPKNRKYYMKDIPMKPEQLLASNDMIVHAYYQAGFIYVEGLNDLGQGINDFETLLERFPENKFKPGTCYELYMLYSKLENKEKSDYYKNLLLTEYPETDFAKLLINPNYYLEVQARQKDMANLYEDTYEAFQKQQYYMVLNNYEQVSKVTPIDSTLLPKFAYLRALAIGKIEVVDSLVAGMQMVIKRYPKSTVKPLAVNVLEYLSKQRNSQGQPIIADTSQVLEPAVRIYTANPDAVHFYILIVNNDKTDVDALKVKISDFNSKFHSLENLQVNSLLLDGNMEMVTVNNFENSEKAVNYYLSIKDNEYIFTKLKQAGEYYQFVITAENYPIFYKNKNIQQYIKFFEKNYPVK